MANQVRINVFCKERTNKSSNQKFKTYCLKNKNGVYYEVRFIEECENRNLLPKDNKPFVLVTEPNCISSSQKTYYKFDEQGLPISSNTKNVMYISKICAIEEYVQPDFDLSEFVD